MRLYFLRAREIIQFAVMIVPTCTGLRRIRAALLHLALIRASITLPSTDTGSITSPITEKSCLIIFLRVHVNSCTLCAVVLACAHALPCNYQIALQDLVAKVDPSAFQAKFGSSVDELQALIDAKTVTIASMMEIAPPVSCFVLRAHFKIYACSSLSCLCCWCISYFV